jgi:simple sugar transport system substrate-binding protein
MKKFSLLTLSFLIILSMVLAACQPAAEEGAGAPGEGLYFRLVTHGGDDPFWAVVQQGMRDACAELGCEADIDLAGGDLADQQKAFTEAVASKPDGIAVVINDDTAWDKPVSDALAEGIPVLASTTMIPRVLQVTKDCPTSDSLKK